MWSFYFSKIELNKFNYVVLEVFNIHQSNMLLSSLTSSAYNTSWKGQDGGVLPWLHSWVATCLADPISWPVPDGSHSTQFSTWLMLAVHRTRLRWPRLVLWCQVLKPCFFYLFLWSIFTRNGRFWVLETTLYINRSFIKKKILHSNKYLL